MKQVQNILDNNTFKPINQSPALDALHAQINPTALCFPNKLIYVNRCAEFRTYLSFPLDELKERTE